MGQWAQAISHFGDTFAIPSVSEIGFNKSIKWGVAHASPLLG